MKKTPHQAMVLLLCRSADGVSFDSVKNALRVPVLSLRYERYSLCAPRGIVSALQRYSVSDIIRIFSDVFDMAGNYAGYMEGNLTTGDLIDMYDKTGGYLAMNEEVNGDDPTNGIVDTETHQAVTEEHSLAQQNNNEEETPTDEELLAMLTEDVDNDESLIDRLVDDDDDSETSEEEDNEEDDEESMEDEYIDGDIHYDA